MTIRHFALKVGATIGAVALAAGVTSCVSAFAASGSTAKASASAATVAARNSDDFLSLVVGSKKWLVYEAEHSVEPIPGVYSSGVPYEVVARTQTGTTKTFSLTDVVNGSQIFADWSLSGNMLTAKINLLQRDGNVSTYTTKAYWWNLATAQTGSMTIPSGSYIGADPNGVLTMNATGTLSERQPNGTITALSRPFLKRPDRITGVSNAAGVIVSGSKVHARYLTFAHPTKVVHLAGPTGDTTSCYAVSGTTTACTTAGAKNGRPKHAALLPLSGAPAIKIPKSALTSPNADALIGARTLVWIASTGKQVNGYGISYVHTYTPKTKTQTVIKRNTAPLSYGSGLISAWGGIAATPPAADRIYINNGTNHLVTLLHAAKA